MNDNARASVKSAARVLDILEWLSQRPDPVALQAIVNYFHFPKSSTLALMLTLVERGYVERDLRDRYALREALRARWATGEAGQLLIAAYPAMHSLRANSRETISLGMLTPEREVRVIAKLNSDHEVRYEADSTQPRPAYCTAMGRVLLSQLPPKELSKYLRATPFPKLTPATVTSAAKLRQIVQDVKRNSLAVVLEEYAVGGSGAAVPVFDAQGRAVAALNLATVTPRFNAQREFLVRELQQWAAQISHRLGAPTNPTNPANHANPDTSYP